MRESWVEMGRETKKTNDFLRSYNGSAKVLRGIAMVVIIIVCTVGGGLFLAGAYNAISANNQGALMIGMGQMIEGLAIAAIGVLGTVAYYALAALVDNTAAMVEAQKIEIQQLQELLNRLNPPRQ